MRNKSKYIIIILIFFISIGFAYLSTNLYISGTSIVKRSAWDVHFNNIQNETCTYQIDSNASISSNSKQVDFTFTFEKPGDSYSFNVDVVNTGNIDAMLESYNVVGLPDEASYLEWNVLYDDGIEFTKYDLLAANSTDTIVVTVNFKEDVDINDLPTGADTSFDLKFIVKYVQADNNATTRESGTYTITYNLDGGTIFNNPTTYTKRLGVTLPNPTKQGYVFDGWTGGKNLFSLENLRESTGGINTTIEEDGSVTFTGILNSNYAHFIPDKNITTLLKNESKYTLSQSNYVNNIYLQFALKNKEDTSNVTYAYSTYSKASVFTANTLTYNYLIQLQSNNTNNWGTQERTYNIKFQLEEGDTPTDWEPYNSANETIDLILPPGTTGNRTYTANWIEN